jgi:hypothetical protein
MHFRNRRIKNEIWFCQRLLPGAAPFGFLEGVGSDATTAYFKSYFFVVDRALFGGATGHVPVIPLSLTTPAYRKNFFPEGSPF